MYLWLAIADIFLDVVTLGLPISMIRKLRMRSRNKWALAGAFSIGSVAVIAATVRLAYALQLRPNSVTDGFMRAEIDGVYQDPTGMSMYLDKVDQYHENV